MERFTSPNLGKFFLVIGYYRSCSISQGYSNQSIVAAELVFKTLWECRYVSVGKANCTYQRSMWSFDEKHNLHMSCTVGEWPWSEVKITWAQEQICEEYKHCAYKLWRGDEFHSISRINTHCTLHTYMGYGLVFHKRPVCSMQFKIKRTPWYQSQPVQIRFRRWSFSSWDLYAGWFNPSIKFIHHLSRLSLFQTTFT